MDLVAILPGEELGLRDVDDEPNDGYHYGVGDDFTGEGERRLGHAKTAREKNLNTVLAIAFEIVQIFLKI